MNDNYEYNDADNFELYLYTKKELLKKPNFPFYICNEPFADYFYKHLLEDFSESRMFKFAGMQYFCINSKAIKRLEKTMQNDLAELQRKELELCEFLDCLQYHLDGNA
jgi:hypothetical protein